MTKRGSYEVGYGRPPKETRFKKGQSGNPRGRSRGVANLRTDLETVMAMPVQVTEKGRAKVVSTQRALLLRLRERALGGDIKALDRAIALHLRLAPPADTPDGEEMSESDERIVAAFIAKIETELVARLAASPKRGRKR